MCFCSLLRNTIFFFTQIYLSRWHRIYLLFSGDIYISCSGTKQFRRMRTTALLWARYRLFPELEQGTLIITLRQFSYQCSILYSQELSNPLFLTLFSLSSISYTCTPFAVTSFFVPLLQILKNSIAHNLKLLCWTGLNWIWSTGRPQFILCFQTRLMKCNEAKLTYSCPSGLLITMDLLTGTLALVLADFTLSYISNN